MDVEMKRSISFRYPATSRCSQSLSVLSVGTIKDIQVSLTVTVMVNREWDEVSAVTTIRMKAVRRLGLFPRTRLVTRCGALRSRLQLFKL